ncbi:MAG: outer membrane protein assembly factor BamD [Acidobacteriaceae bacterium]
MSRPFSNDLFRSFMLFVAAPCLAATLMGSPAFAAVPSSQQTDATTMTQSNAQPEAKAEGKKEKRERKKKKEKKEKVVQSKDTKKAKQRERKLNKSNPLAGVETALPDKQLYDKAMLAMKKGKYDIARLDLQTLLNTYPDSQFQMRAKLAIGDSWYKEGGTAALTQAEAEYKDFITFFPNQPEAAEAQMRVADIYYRQMAKPDRDFTNAKRAEDEYRTMIQQFPDSTLVPQAKQRLREVQEVLATREADVASFYSSRENWAAAIARYQTLVDTYPLYSHSDEALLALGDAYASEAKIVSNMRLPEGPKARLEKTYNDLAAKAYQRVVTRYPAAPHVDDAKDRLLAMNYPVPTPTAAAIAESEAEESSRANVTLKDRALIMITRRPDTVSAARVGEPTLVDPKQTLAPEITRQSIAAFREALNPVQASSGPANAATPAQTSAATPAQTPAATTPAQPAAPLQLQNVQSSDAGAAETNSAVTTDQMTGAAAATQAPAGNSTSMQIVSPSAASPDANGGLKAVGPTNNTPLPAVEKPAAAPDTVNDVKSAPVAQSQLPTTAAKGKKQPKPAYDSSKASSSKHKKKKGLNKLNPF